MSDGKETAVLGYIIGVVFLAMFFWLVPGDAYGRFMIGFNPAQSIMGHELRFYTGRATGLVCLVAPFGLAYLPRYVIGQWVEAGWDYSARASLWMLANGKRLAGIIWRRLSDTACVLRDSVHRKIDDDRK